MLHEMMQTWFEWSRDGGYAGVFFMMALESTIVPIPSEIVIPPAAFWASQGPMNIWGVILAGGAGSTFGSTATYGFTYWVGRAFVQRWGRYFLLPPERMALAEAWLTQFALGGVFFARLLPVVRHLIGFPAGLLRFPLLPFVGVTFVGSTLWCAVLAFFGQKTLGKHPKLIEDPEQMAHVLKAEMGWFVALVVALGAGWLFVRWFQGRAKTA